MTKENGRGELGQKERRKESLPGCVTTAMVIHVGREAAHTPSHFSQCILINARYYHQQGHTDGGRGKREGEEGEWERRGRGEAYNVNNRPSLLQMNMGSLCSPHIA